MGDGVGQAVARTGLTIAGTFAGAALGGPFGAFAGSIIGTALGGLLFPVPSTTVSVGRIDDLKVTTSSYGNPIPWVYGTGRIGGTYIWAEDVIENVVKQTESGKGGGGTVTKTYYYSANFAVLLCRSEDVADLGVEKVLQVFADGKLIVDFTTTSGPVFSSTYVTDQNSPYDTGTIRIYLGGESQQPDSLLESKLGVGTTPAFRGYCYLVFEDMPLGDFGNRIPQITATVSTNATGAFPKQDILTGSAGNPDLAFWFPDRVRILVDGAKIYSTQTGTLITTYSYSDGEDPPGVGPGPTYIDQFGFMYAVSLISGDVGDTLFMYEGDTGKLFGRSTSGTLQTSMRTNEDIRSFGSIIAPRVCVCNGTTNDVWIGKQPLTIPPEFAFGSIAEVNKYDITDYIAGASLGGTEVFDSQILATDADGICYILGTKSSDTIIIELDITSGLPNTSYTISGRTDVEFMTYCQVTDSLIMLASNKDLLKFDLATQTLVSTVANAGDQQNGGIFETDIIDGVVWLQTNVAGNSYRRFNTRDMTTDITITPTTGWSLDSGNHTPLYDPINNALIVADGVGNAQYVQIFLDRALGGSETVQAIVENITASTEVGLTVATDIDASELTDTLPFFVVGERTQAGSAIEQLASVFFFDPVEIEEKIFFPKRGKATVATLTDTNDLGAVEELGDEEVLIYSRTKESDLTFRFELNYMDLLTDYQAAVQEAHRNYDVARTRRSKSSNVPMALDNDEARRRAEISLHREWIERTEYAFKVNIEHIRLDPGDNIIATIGANSHVITIKTTELGANFIYECTGIGFPIATVAEADAILAGIYTLSDTLGAASDGFTAQTIGLVNPTQMELLDIPLLRDQDDGPGFYIAARGITPDTSWNGAFIWRSPDGATYDEFLFYPPDRVAVIGSAATILADQVRWTVWDDDSTVQVSFPVVGAPSSSTDLGVLNGANYFLIGDEIIGAVTVVDDGGGKYTLSRLLRGRLGTDWATGTHVLSERVVILTSSVLIHTGTRVQIGDDDVAYFYKALTANGLASNVIPKSFTWIGRTLMPYGPAAPSGVKSGNDWSLAATRRTRIDGQWRDNVDVPLAEDSEAYELDIMDSVGTTVVRPVTGLSTPAYTYAEADIKTDFGDPLPSLYPKYELTTKWYQVSAAVGRGLAKTTTHLDVPFIPDPNPESVLLVSNLIADPPIDGGPNEHVFTANNVSVSTTIKRWQNFNLASGSASNLAVSDHADWDFLANEFTIEIWVYWTALGASVDGLANHGTTSPNRSWLFQWDNSPANLEFAYSTNGTSWNFHRTSFTPTLNTWHYLAVDRDSSNDLRLYIDNTNPLTNNIGADSFFATSTSLDMLRAITGVLGGIRISDIARKAGVVGAPDLPFPNP